jgi:hypothetical protein
MTTRFPTWYGKPPEFIKLRRHVGMPRGSAMLYDYLCWVSDRRSSRKFELEEKEVADMSDVSIRRLRDARNDLAARGLIVSERRSGGRYVFELCDPATGLPYPGNPNHSIRSKKESPMPEPADEKPAAPAVPPAIEARDVLQENVGDASEEGLDDSTDVSFFFGWNTVPQPRPERYVFEFA